MKITLILRRLAWPRVIILMVLISAKGRLTLVISCRIRSLGIACAMLGGRGSHRLVVSVGTSVILVRSHVALVEDLARRIGEQFHK